LLSFLYGDIYREEKALRMEEFRSFLREKANYK
jgi:hypothetical protein